MQNQNPSRSNPAPNVFIQQTPLPQASQPGYYQQQYGQPNPTNAYMGQPTGTGPMASGMGGGSQIMPGRSVAASSTSSYAMSPANYQLQSPSVVNPLGSPPMYSGGGPTSVPPIGGPASVGPASVGPAPGSVPPPPMKAESLQQPVTPARSDAVDSAAFQSSQSREQPLQQQQQRVAEPPRPTVSTVSQPYSQEVLDRLDAMSPMGLAMTARELVQEVINRSYGVTTALMKMSADKQHRGGVQQQNDPDELLTYCDQLMRRITEVRIRLDRLEQKEMLAPLTEDDYLLMVAHGADQSDKPQTDSETFALLKENHRKAMIQYEQNRERLLKLSSGLKSIEWEAAVSTPILSRKSDRTN
uniref:Mediator complex subunit 30 n=1 Tax=Plectus sambesii TaxID=2011161 RepID=A0A914V2R8_9BILA